MSKGVKYPLLTVLLILALGLVYGGFVWRQTEVIERPQLAVAFEHIDHSAEPCADCHHNFIDDTGGGACYNCHKQTPELALDIEEMFHDFCRGCHLEKRMNAQDSGPLRQCSLCHP